MFIDAGINEVSLRSGFFDALVNDADAIINTVLRNMENNGLHKGEVSIKIKIATSIAEEPDPDGIHANRTREIIVPIFSHEISSVFEEKLQRSGIICGNYELIFDDTENRYVIREVKTQQTVCLTKNNP